MDSAHVLFLKTWLKEINRSADELVLSCCFLFQVFYSETYILAEISSSFFNGQYHCEQSDNFRMNFIFFNRRKITVQPQYMSGDESFLAKM